MNVFERIDFSIFTYLAFLFNIRIVCSEFEIISMKSSLNIEILPEEVMATISSNHWIECTRKCKELEIPSTCNTIKFDQATNNCFLAYKEIIQNICPSISKRSPKGSFKRRKRAGFHHFSSQVFSLKSSLPNGDFILIDDEAVTMRHFGDPNDRHFRNGQVTNYYYNTLPPWLHEKFPIPGSRHYKVNSNPQILYLPKQTKTYLLRKTDWNGPDLSCWIDTGENGNWIKDGESKIYYRIMDAGIYHLDVNKALYLFEELHPTR